MATFGPTSYSWRPDVAREVRSYIDLYSCSANTYIDHPPGFSLDRTSADFWSPAGRGSPIGKITARRIVRRIKRRFRQMPWRWIIYNNQGWYPDGTKFRPPGGAEWNRGHVHVTYH